MLGQLRGSVLSKVAECAGYFCFKKIIRDETGILDLSMMDEVISLADQLKVDTIMPADLTTNYLVSRWMEKGDPSHLAVPTPAPDLVINLHDKWTLTKALADLDIPFPESELAHSEEDVLATNLEFPIITKPLTMASSEGVQLHRTREDLVRTVESGNLFKAMPLLVQRFIPGDDIGYSFLASKGKVLASALCCQMCRGKRRYFQDKRMDEHVEKLLGVSGYDGVGHIDARYDPDEDKYSILEVNPRFWASVLYAAHAGVNFPADLLRCKRGEALQMPILRRQPINLSVYERMVTQAVRAVERNYFSRGVAS